MRTTMDYEITNIPLFTQTLLRTDCDNTLRQDVHNATEEFTDTPVTAASQALPVKTQIRQKDKHDH